MSIGEIVGLILAGLFGSGSFIALIVFAIKAQIHKQIAPYKKTVSNLETKVTLFEQSHDTIIELIRDIPNQIDKKIASREELVNKDIGFLKERLDSKQDKI